MVRNKVSVLGFVCLLGGALGGCPAESSSDGPPGVNPPVAGAAGTQSVTGGTGGSAAGTGGSAAGTGGVAAGTGGSEAGTGGSVAGTGGTGGGGAMGDGKDVITMGDSYMRIPPSANMGDLGIEVSLAEVSGRPYRQYGFKGAPAGQEQTTVIGMLGGIIPKQFMMAVAEDPDIKTVIVEGGGNDILDVPDDTVCASMADEASLSAACKEKMDRIVASIADMFADMAAAGVLDIVWVGYGDVPTMDGPPLIGKPTVAGSIAYMNTKVEELCVADGSLGLNCHFIDTHAAVAGKHLSDGFHPSKEGDDAIATLIWQLLQDKDLAR